MSAPETFDDLARAALEGIGLPPRPAGRSLLRIAKRMGKVLGVKDLAKDQRLPDAEARLNVRTFAASVAMTLHAEKVQWSEAEEFDARLQARFGVRKFVIAAGKSKRFSPTELIHKQIARPDGSNTNLAQARLAARIGALPDAVVVDPMVAYQLMARVPIDARDGVELMDRVAHHFDETARALAKKTKLSSLREELLELAASRLRFARHPEQEDDFADLMRQFGKLLAHAAVLDAAEQSVLLDEVGYAAAAWLIAHEDYLSPEDVVDLCGPGCIVAVAPSQGPGAAYKAGIGALAKRGELERARYSLCVYSDYPAFLLDEYPNLYLATYLRAANRFELQSGEPVLCDGLPVITIGAKQPRDTVRDRGNIMLADSSAGLVPQAVREWRDMSQDERDEAQARFDAKQHAINAGIFYIDTAWAVRQLPLLMREWDHPDPGKGKLHEYWYTDLVAIAADQNAPRRVIWLGENAPLGNKDVASTREYAESMHAMMRRKLAAIGVAVDAHARVNIVVRDAGMALDDAIAAVFLSGRAAADQIFVAGDVEIDSSVQIEDGTVLDGRSRPVVLRGATLVGQGATLRGVVADDTEFEPCATLDGYSYEPPRLCGSHGCTWVCEARLVDSLVQTGAVIEGSEVHRCYVAGRVVGCELDTTVVAADETLEGVSAHGRLATLAGVLYDPEHYIPGVMRLHEMPASAAAQLIRAARREYEAMLRHRVAAPAARQRARASGETFYGRCPFITEFTPELMDLFVAGEARRAAGGDAFASLKREWSNAFRAVASQEMALAASLSAESADAEAFVRRLAQLAARMNVLADGAAMEGGLDALVEEELAIDDTAALAQLALGPGPGMFLYVLDRVGEAEVDAALCAALCQLGHRVVMVGKSKPVGCCATWRDADALVGDVPLLRRLRGEGRLRVIESGASSRGLLLDRPSRELEAALLSDTLKAVVLKGQDNLHTTCVRNRLKAPVFALLVPRGAAACEVAGLPMRRGKPAQAVVAFLPAGERVVALHSDGTMEGSLRVRA